MKLKEKYAESVNEDSLSKFDFRGYIEKENKKRYEEDYYER